MSDSGAVLGREIPEHVKAFIAEHIRSVVELEALVLLQKHRDRDWTAVEMGKELRIDEQWAAQNIVDLTQRGLAWCSADQPPRCRYAPKTMELDQAIQELALLYDQRRVSVIQLIYSKPTDPIQSFAEAFRFRKGKR